MKRNFGDDGSVGEELLSGIPEIELQCNAVEHAVRDGYFTLNKALKNFKVKKSEYNNYLKMQSQKEKTEKQKERKEKIKKIELRK